MEGRLLLGQRPEPLLYDRKTHERPSRSVSEKPKPERASVEAASNAPLASAAPRANTAARAEGVSVVTVEDEAGVHRVTLQASQFLLEGALSQNVNLPFSCTLGGCGTCRVQLLEGEMELEEPHCLTPEELAAGYRLSCVGRVTSRDCRVRVSREE